MKDFDLNKKLDGYQAPEPSELLKSRIMKAATASPVPARPSFAKRFMPIAASLLAVCAIGFGTMQFSQTQETESAAWQEAATDLGFEEVYNWVEAEETAAQES